MVYRCRISLFACLLLLSAAILPAAGAPRVETGLTIPAVPCLEDPGFSYALYLPSSYDPSLNWPVIFAFDPFGEGTVPVHLLSEAAERYGYIVAGSNDSRNGDWGPITDAQNALWRDVTARFAVDTKRCYATGFSGGARSALWFALDHPQQVAGVILCGAVYPRPREVPTDGRLAIYGLVGDADLNLTEHLELDELLEGSGTRQWQEVFAGWHQWPSRALYTEAVEFMELAAMEGGLMPRNRDFIGRLAAERLHSARMLEREGKPLLALRKYRQTAEGFPGLAEEDEARAAARRLARHQETRKQLRLEREYLEEVRMSKQWLDRDTFTAALERLRRRARGGGPLAARARLALHLTSIRLTEMAMKLAAEGHLEEAEAFCLIGIAAYPENPYAAFHAARYSARLGKGAETLQFLENSARHHFDRLDLLQADQALQRLRLHPGFRGVEEAISRNRDRGIGPLRYFYCSPELQGGPLVTGSPGQGFEVVHGRIPRSRG